MITSELSKIERSVIVAAPRSRVWRALTNVREFCRWFSAETAHPEGSFQPGVRVRLVSTAETCSGSVFFVEIEEMTPEQIFSWRWHPGTVQPDVDYSNEPMTLVTFLLEDAAAGTKVTVTESGFDRLSLARRAGVFEGNRAGWDHQMNALEKYLREAA
ncbi:MAG: SRPBCC family protein [Acidobacteriaceae bacterium]|nr:SRPBCC family protein [Acidobacteriaceae bacterium]